MKAPDLFSEIASSVEAESTPATPIMKPRTARALTPVDGHAPTQETTAHVIAAMSASAPRPQDRIGSLVWWNSRDIVAGAWRLRDAVQVVDDMRARDDAGEAIGPSFAELIKAPVNVPEAAARAMRRRQAGLPDGLRWYDIGNDAAGTTLIALATQVPDAAARDWTGRAILVVGFRSDSSIEWPSSTLHRDAVTSLVDRFNVERSNLTAPDIGKVLADVMLKKLPGIRVKDGGGLYFVPAPDDVYVQRLAAAFSIAGVHLRLATQRADDAVEISKDARSSFLEDVQRLIDEAREAEAQAAFNDKPSVKQQDKRLRDLRDIREKAELYRTVLGSLSSEVDDACRVVETVTMNVKKQLAESW